MNKRIRKKKFKQGQRIIRIIEESIVNKNYQRYLARLARKAAKTLYKND